MSRLDDQTLKEKASEKSLIDKMRSSGKSIVIFYGSQTGTAEEFAQRIAKNLRLYGLKALVVDPEETDIVNLNHYYSIFKKNLLIYL